MNNPIITVPCTLDSANRKKDRSVKFAFTTSREVPIDEYTVIDSLFQSSGWMMFSPNELSFDDIPKEDAPSDMKTPSQRLKDVLYVLHMQRNGDPAKFRLFYESALEKYINQVKDKLENK